MDQTCLQSRTTRWSWPIVSEHMQVEQPHTVLSISIVQNVVHVLETPNTKTITPSFSYTYAYTLYTLVDIAYAHIHRICHMDTKNLMRLYIWQVTDASVWSLRSFFVSTPNPHITRMYVSDGPVTGEYPAEESGDRDLNIKQPTTHIAHTKLVIFHVLGFLYPPPSTPPHLTTTIIMHTHACIQSIRSCCFSGGDKPCWYIPCIPSS